MNEQGLFTLVKTHLVPDLTKTSDQYDCVDAVSEKYGFHIEFKCRRTHYNDLLLEKKKYDTMMAKAARLGYTPIYINSTPNGIYIFRLADITPTWVTRKMPAQTDFSRTEKIDKEVMFLQMSQASRVLPLPATP